jgi:hypothetical protein
MPAAECTIAALIAALDHVIAWVFRLTVDHKAIRTDVQAIAKTLEEIKSALEKETLDRVKAEGEIRVVLAKLETLLDKEVADRSAKTMELQNAIEAVRIAMKTAIVEEVTKQTKPIQLLAFGTAILVVLLEILRFAHVIP